MSPESTIRIRITFRKGDPVKYISHLDLLRTWERILRRARLPLAYSQGFGPHPKITIGLPLPVGCTGEGELLDVILDEPLRPVEVGLALAPVLPSGISIVAVEQVSLKSPAVPSIVERVTYELAVAELPRSEIERRVRELMAQDAIRVNFRRKTFDLRPLIGEVRVKEPISRENRAIVVEATLLRDERGRIGRPDVLLEALGMSEYATKMHRTKIGLGTSDA